MCAVVRASHAKHIPPPPMDPHPRGHEAQTVPTITKSQSQQEPPPPACILLSIARFLSLFQFPLSFNLFFTSALSHPFSSPCLPLSFILFYVSVSLLSNLSSSVFFSLKCFPPSLPHSPSLPPTSPPILSHKIECLYYTMTADGSGETVFLPILTRTRPMQTHVLMTIEQ